MPFQRESEMDSLSYEDFPAQLDRKLTYGAKSQTQLTLVQYIQSFMFKKIKQSKTGMMKNIAKLT